MTLRGIWSAAITPVDQSFEPDGPRAVAYYRDLLNDGIDGITLLGTNGEAMSFSVEQRLRLMEAVAAGVPRERTMCGTGATALADAIRLTRAAEELGFVAALVMPPFFYRNASDDGILRFYDSLISATAIPLLLYNFPHMSGITFHPALVGRLVAEFPRRIVGIKDSSNDAAYQRAVIALYPELSIFQGSEAHLIDALAYGAAGCISGSVALWARLAHDVFVERDPSAGARLDANRTSLESKPLIPQVHAHVAEQKRDDAWKRVVPPLMPAE